MCTRLMVTEQLSENPTEVNFIHNKTELETLWLQMYHLKHPKNKEFRNILENAVAARTAVVFLCRT